MQIYSLAVGVCCKASALAASALATNTYVSAINMHQGSAADLNPYNTVYMWGLRGSYLWGLNICVGQEDREGAEQILGRISVQDGGGGY